MEADYAAAARKVTGAYPQQSHLLDSVFETELPLLAPPQVEADYAAAARAKNPKRPFGFDKLPDVSCCGGDAVGRVAWRRLLCTALSRAGAQLVAARSATAFVVAPALARDEGLPACLPSHPAAGRPRHHQHAAGLQGQEEQEAVGCWFIFVELERFAVFSLGRRAAALQAKMTTRRWVPRCCLSPHGAGLACRHTGRLLALLSAGYPPSALPFPSAARSLERFPCCTRCHTCSRRHWAPSPACPSLPLPAWKACRWQTASRWTAMHGCRHGRPPMAGALLPGRLGLGMQVALQLRCDSSTAAGALCSA